MLKQMHGITLPKSEKHARELDPVNGNTLWQDAMAKNIDLMKEFKVFKTITEGM